MSRPHRRFPLVTPILLGVFGILLSLAFIAVKSLTSPATRVETPRIEFVVERGDSVVTIADNLYQASLIRSPLGFRYIVKRRGLAPELQSGIYYLSPNMDAEEIAQSLTRGVADLKLTIPEGFRLEEIASTVQDELDIPVADFLQAASGKEGYLFPDTYFLAPDSTADQVVKAMEDNFDKKVGSIDKNTLILASLIERETRGDDEKPLVAGVLQKRLESGWPLELDASIQYILGNSDEWWPVTTVADRQTPSAYNTYLHPGLPPAPISNPGLASIDAARSPQSSQYWFYLHDSEGRIHYAATLEEHNANIEKYIR